MSHPRLGVSLSRAHHAFMAALDAQLQACGLAGSVRPGTGPVLFELLDEDDLTLSEVSARARLAQSTVTEIVAKMAAAGLLRRRPDARDGRASRLRLTPKARALRARLKELDRRLDLAFAVELSAREVATLIRLLERLRSALTARPQDPPLENRTRQQGRDGRRRVPRRDETRDRRAPRGDPPRLRRQPQHIDSRPRISDRHHPRRARG